MNQPEPSLIEAALRQIRADNDGILTAKAIVNASRPDSALLHVKFEWDNDVAGERYRLQQARQLVRVVRQGYIDKRGDPQRIRVFHSLPAAGSPTGRAYVTLEELQASEVMSAQLLRQMETDWRSLRRRYGQYEDWWKMVRRDMPGGNGDDGDGPLNLGDEDDGDGEPPEGGDGGGE